MSEVAEKESLNEREASEFVGVSERTLFSLRKAGEIPFNQIRGRIVYRRSRLERWLRETEQGGRS